MSNTKGRANRAKHLGGLIRRDLAILWLFRCFVNGRLRELHKEGKIQEGAPLDEALCKSLGGMHSGDARFFLGLPNEKCNGRWQKVSIDKTIFDAFEALPVVAKFRLYSYVSKLHDHSDEASFIKNTVIVTNVPTKKRSELEAQLSNLIQACREKFKDAWKDELRWFFELDSYASEASLWNIWKKPDSVALSRNKVKRGKGSYDPVAQAINNSLTNLARRGYLQAEKVLNGRTNSITYFAGPNLFYDFDEFFEMRERMTNVPIDDVRVHGGVALVGTQTLARQGTLRRRAEAEILHAMQGAVSQACLVWLKDEESELGKMLRRFADTVQEIQRLADEALTCHDDKVEEIMGKIETAQKKLEENSLPIVVTDLNRFMRRFLFAPKTHAFEKSKEELGLENAVWEAIKSTFEGEEQSEEARAVWDEMRESRHLFKAK